LIISTIVLFLLVDLSYERGELRRNLESSAKLIAGFISQVPAGSIIVEDYSSAVEHCMKVIRANPSILCIVCKERWFFPGV